MQISTHRLTKVRKDLNFFILVGHSVAHEFDGNFSLNLLKW